MKRRYYYSTLPSHWPAAGLLFSARRFGSHRDLGEFRTTKTTNDMQNMQRQNARFKHCDRHPDFNYYGELRSALRATMHSGTTLHYYHSSTTKTAPWSFFSLCFVPQKNLFNYFFLFFFFFHIVLQRPCVKKP